MGSRYHIKLERTKANYQIYIYTPPPPAECLHSPYTEFVAGTGCQDGEQQTTCNPSTIGGQTATPTDGTCIASLPAGATIGQVIDFADGCFSIGASKTFTGTEYTGFTCTIPSIPNCPPPEGSTQTPTVVNGRCTIQPGAK